MFDYFEHRFSVVDMLKITFADFKSRPKNVMDQRLHYISCKRQL